MNVIASFVLFISSSIVTNCFAYSPELFPVSFCWYGKSCVQESRILDTNCPQKGVGVSYCNPKYTMSYRIPVNASFNSDTGKSTFTPIIQLKNEKGEFVFEYYREGVYYNGKKVCKTTPNTSVPYVDDFKPCPYFIDGPIRYLTRGASGAGQVVGAQIVLDHFEASNPNNPDIGKGWVEYKGQKLYYEKNFDNNIIRPDNNDGQKEFKELLEKHSWIKEYKKRFFEHLRANGAINLAKKANPLISPTGEYFFKHPIKLEETIKDPNNSSKEIKYRISFKINSDNEQADWPTEEAKKKYNQSERAFLPEEQMPDQVNVSVVGEEEVHQWYDESPFFRDLIERCFSEEMQGYSKSSNVSASAYINFYLKEATIFYPLQMRCQMNFGLLIGEYRGFSMKIDIQRASAGMTDNDAYIWLY